MEKLKGGVTPDHTLRIFPVRKESGNYKYEIKNSYRYVTSFDKLSDAERFLSELQLNKFKGWGFL